jgi:lactoylglutathione lyase
MRIDHTALYCKELEQMRRFFINYFDARSNEQYHNPRTGLRTYILAFGEGGARLELMAQPGTLDADPSEQRIGYTHLSFATGSKEGVDGLTSRLASDGYTVKSGPRTTGDGYYESCIIGPEGIQIEITE